MSDTPLSMRERMRLDALFVRVREGDHYEVLGVKPDASDAVIAQEFDRLRGFLEELLRPERALGDHRVRAEAVLRSVENAGRILRDGRQRMRYDEMISNLGRALGSAAPEATLSESPTKDLKRSEQRLRSETILPAHLLAALEALLGVVIRREVNLRALTGGSLDLSDPSAAQREAERAERDERWSDAALWWHLAALAAPTDGALFLRAGSALRRSGVTNAFERYQQVVKGNLVFAESVPAATRPRRDPSPR